MTEAHTEEELLDVDTVLTIAASDVARYISTKNPEGNEERAVFDSQFEKAYQNLGYRLSKSMYYLTPAMLEEFYQVFNNSPFQEEARTMVMAFLTAGMVGLTPKNQFRAISKTRYIAAKPDLYNSITNQYFEFKTYPLCEYSRNQARIFSWVIKQPIVLIGFKNGEVEMEVISADDFEIPDLPRDAFTETPRDRVKEEPGPFHHHHGSNNHSRYYDEYDCYVDIDDWDDDYEEEEEDFYENEEEEEDNW